MATVRYFYIEDNTAILFGANGTALTASLAAMAGLISEVKFPLPVFPLWAYFAGLVCAFLCKMIIESFNGDVREREKSQSIRDFVMEVSADKSIPEEHKPDLDALWTTMEQRRNLLLTESMTKKLDRWRLLLFAASALCFLVGTSSILVFVGSHTQPETASAVTN
ncbi:hypothetical protein [Mesorhizobium amorphae]